MVSGNTFRFLLREPWPRIIGIPIVGAVLTFFYRGPDLGLMEFALSIVITGIVWQGCYFIIMGFRRRWPGVVSTPRRITVTIGALCVYVVAIDFTICSTLAELGVQPNSYLTGHWVGNLVKSFSATFLIGSIYEAGYFFMQWKQQAIETEAMKSQHLRSELSVLKNQISPHFLFNSLNTLVTLIHEDAEQAARFTQKLSDVYRYILQHKDKEVVDLRTELEFTEAYNYLMKMRFEQSIDIRLNVDEGSRSLLIAPLTLQMLVENAVKHNVASIASPLRVDIYVENGRSLIVRNNLRRKQTVEGSTGTGLANIKQRYAYLSDRQVDVIETREHFLVALPLLEMAAHPETVRA